MQKDVAALLFDKSGKIKPFHAFQKDVEPVIGKYRKDWLRTEYATAIQRSRIAAQWQQFSDEADVFPNLEWVQSTSAHPGADHQIFWGVIQPVNAPFWDRHRPGDRWNCQCSLQQTDEEPTDIPSAPIGDTSNSPSPGLDNNPGKDGILFNDHHPYFPQSCASCPFSATGKKLFALVGGRKKNCYECINAKNECNKVSKTTENIEYLIDKAEKGHCEKIVAEIGYIPERVLYFLKNNAEKLCGEKITVAGRKMFISDVQIAHALRKFKKDQGKSVSIHDIIDIQKNIKHSTVYFDIRHKNILFLFQKKDKSIIKYCFDINYKLRGNSSAIYFITAGKINKTDIENNTKNYIEIK